MDCTRLALLCGSVMALAWTVCYSRPAKGSIFTRLIIRNAETTLVHIKKVKASSYVFPLVCDGCVQTNGQNVLTWPQLGVSQLVAPPILSSSVAMSAYLKQHLTRFPL